MNELQYDDPRDNFNTLIATTLFAAALGFLLFRPRRTNLSLQQSTDSLQQSSDRPDRVVGPTGQLQLSRFIPEQDLALMAPLSGTLH